MFKVHIHTLFILIFYFSIAVGAQKEGPESGGGGGVIYLNSQYQLIDFFNIPGGSALLEKRYSEGTSSFIQAPISFSISRGDKIEDPALQTVLEIFNDWSALPFDTIGLSINSAIFKPVIWKFTDEKLIEPRFYRPVAAPENLDIITTAYYLQKNKSFTVSISRSIWNELSLKDQVGLLIHETLRHIQIAMSYGFDDEALQKATAMMMICQPRIKYNQYLFYLLNNRRDLAEKRFESFDKLTSECRRQQ